MHQDRYLTTCPGTPCERRSGPKWAARAPRRAGGDCLSNLHSGCSVRRTKWAGSGPVMGRSRFTSGSLLGQPYFGSLRFTYGPLRPTSVPYPVLGVVNVSGCALIQPLWHRRREGKGGVVRGARSAPLRSGNCTICQYLPYRLRALHGTPGCLRTGEYIYSTIPRDNKIIVP